MGVVAEIHSAHVSMCEQCKRTSWKRPTRSPLFGVPDLLRGEVCFDLARKDLRCHSANVAERWQLEFIWARRATKACAFAHGHAKHFPLHLQLCVGAVPCGATERY